MKPVGVKSSLDFELCEEISPDFFAFKDPSRLITMSALFIISMLCPDRILPRRSGTGSATATEPEATGDAVPRDSPTEMGLATG